jgi:hypothetical protein
MFFSNKKIDNLDQKVSSIESRLDQLINETSLHQREQDVSVLSDTPIPEDQKIKVAYALNLCAVSVSQIIDYKDIYILEQEYDAILNNLNIQNFVKDEALLTVLKQLLDTITFFRIQEGDKKFIEKEYQQKMKNAIWSAAPNLALIFAGGDPVTMAIAAATQIGIGYMNYRKNKNQYLLEKEKQEWELQRTAIEQFNSLRRDLFEAAWRLSEKYDFSDKYRLTEKQITQYNEILLDPDPLRRYERLDSISEIFGAFPPYWYYKGNAAKEVFHLYKKRSDDIALNYKNIAHNDYQQFRKIYTPFMREDVIAASCFLENLALLPPETEIDEKKKLLDDAIELAGNNLDVLQLCIFHYIEINDDEKAEFVLRKLVNEDYNTSLNGKILSRLYWKNKDKNKYSVLKDRIGPFNVVPWIDNLKEVGATETKNAASRNYLKFISFVRQYEKKLRMTYTIPDDFKNTCDDFVVQLQKASSKNDEKEIRNAFLTELIDANFPMRINNILNDVFSDFAYSNIVTIGGDIKNEAWEKFFETEAERLMEQNAMIFDETIYMLSANKYIKTGAIIASGFLGLSGIFLSPFIGKLIEEKDIKNLKIEWLPDLPTKRMNAGINSIYARLLFDEIFLQFFDNLRNMFKEQISLIGKESDTENNSVSHDMVNNILEDMFQKNQFLLPPENTSPDSDTSDSDLVYREEENQERKNFFVFSKGSKIYFEYALEYPYLKREFERIIETSIPKICKSSDNVSYNIETIYRGTTSDAIANIVLASDDGPGKILVFCYDKVIINGKPYLYLDGFEKIKSEIQSYKDELELDALRSFFDEIKKLQNKFAAELSKNKENGGT